MAKNRGWRIHEGGGRVNGKILMLCFEWRSEQQTFNDDFCASIGQILMTAPAGWTRHINLWASTLMGRRQA